jgi:L-threonylcarbamoyladenylate synthase
MTQSPTRRVVVDARSPSLEALREPASALAHGKLVVFPTETVYGIGANALDEQAVRSIFAAKGRPATNPLIVHVTSVDAARALTSEWPEQATQLVARFWPGPLTLVLPKHPDVPDVVTASRPNVAIRQPAHPVAHALLELAGVPVCAPSANIYMSTSPTRASHIRELAGRVDWIVDGGPTQVGVESTVLSLLDPERPMLLRPGMITPEAIAQVLGVPVLTPEQGHVHDSDTQGALSPGMAARHYAPHAELRVVTQVPWANLQGGVGVLCFDASERVGDASIHVMEIARDPELYARALYDALHRFDEHGVSVIYVQQPPRDDEAWRAVHDRLARAATPE